MQVEHLYQAAANAGLLQECRWQPGDGRAVEIRWVGFGAPDTGVFDGLGVSTDYTMTYPNTWLVGLARQDQLLIAAHPYQVRDIRALGDGSELRATLTRL